MRVNLNWAKPMGLRPNRPCEHEWGGHMAKSRENISFVLVLDKLEREESSRARAKEVRRIKIKSSYFLRIQV